MVDLRLPPLVNVIPDPEAKLYVERLKLAALAQGAAGLSLLIWGDFTSLLWVIFSAYYVWSAISDSHVIRTRALGAIISTSYFVILAGLYDILLPITALFQGPQRQVHFKPEDPSGHWVRVVVLSAKALHYGVTWLLIIRFLIVTWSTFEMLHTSANCRGAPSGAGADGSLRFPFLRWDQGSTDSFKPFTGRGHRTVDV